MKKWLLLSLIFSFNVYAEEGRSFTEDFKTTFRYLYQGAYLQFTQKSNLYYGAAATGSLWYAFEEDDRVVASYMKKDLPKHMEITGDVGIALNFPIMHLGLYYLGRYQGNDKLMEFAMEYAAAMYLTLAEIGLMSYIPIHERPSLQGVSFWETEFRGDSSFPSGHVVPYTTLFFKTLQFYGPYWAIIPGVLSYWSAYQRMQEGRHYFSDVLGAFFLSAFASEGVRAAANKNHNHPFYKWIFEHEAHVTPYFGHRKGGLKLSLTY